MLDSHLLMIDDGFTSGNIVLFTFFEELRNFVIVNMISEFFINKGN